MALALPKRIALWLFWLLPTGAGFAVLLNYQITAGGAGNSPGHWPSGALTVPDPARDTLVMFAHPRCPCTRASIEELNRLLAWSQGRVDVEVWFFRPANFADGWAQTDLWRGAAAIPGVRVREDLDGAQARLFGAETSGYVLLYDTRGNLLFKGGITGSRGHAGDNAGEAALESVLAGREAKLGHTPVYGCSLTGQCTTPGGVFK